MAPGWKPQEQKPATPPAARPSSAGVLKVTLVEGKELLAVDKGGTSDPFAVLQLLDQYDNPHGKPQKSKPIKKTLAPQWKQSFQFPLPATVVGFKLRVVVQDQDRGLFGAKPATNLGTAYLSMAMLAPGTVQDNWFKLERVGDMQRVSGAVRVAWARYAVGDDRGAKKGRKSSLDHLVDVDGKETPAEEAIDEAVDDDDLSEAGVAKREADAFDAAYSTGSATGTFETTPGMGAKFCAAAWDSRRTFVVSPSTVLNLTLIDLPGLVRTVTEGQNPQVIVEVNNLIEAYLAQSRTIILAVVPSNVDVATVDILERAQNVDPTGERTIGVLTKPDLIDRGSEAEVVQVLTNVRKPLKLG